MKRRKPIVRAFGYLRHFPVQIAVNIVCNVLAIFFNLFSFVLIIPFAELLFGLTTPPATEPAFALSQQALTDWLMWHLYAAQARWGVWRCLLTVSAGYLLCNLAYNGLRYVSLFAMARIRSGVTQHMLDDLYRRLTLLPLSFFYRQRKGDIISRATNDMNDVGQCIDSTLQSMLKEPINIVVFAGTLVFISPRLFLYFLLILPPAVWLIGKIGHSLKRNSTRGQTKLGTLFATLDETLNGVRVIKAYGNENQSAKRFAAVNDDYTHTMTRVVSRRELSGPLSEVLGTIGLAAILVIGGSLVMNGTLASSVFVFFIIIFARLIPPVQGLVKAYNNLQKGAASATRIYELLDADEVIREAPDAVSVDGFHDRIELRDVGLTYRENGSDADRYALRNVSLTLSKGRTVALVGPSGAGKSTLVDLLPRFYDCTEGDITFDGTSLRQLNITSLRKQFGLVSQDCILFNDTVAANIAFGSTDYSLSQIEAAARTACADDFIRQLPQGYATRIGDRGVMLSGGQRQRISIARAVLKNPPILLLDEATSALDNESERAVQQALSRLMKGRTTLVVAHRLSTIRNADEIVVLQDGHIVQQGTHDQLMECDGLYRKLVEMQDFSR